MLKLILQSLKSKKINNFICCRRKQILAEERAKNSTAGSAAEEPKSYGSESNHKAVLSYCTMEQGLVTQQVNQ